MIGTLNRNRFCSKAPWRTSILEQTKANLGIWSLHKYTQLGDDQTNVEVHISSTNMKSPSLKLSCVISVHQLVCHDLVPCSQCLRPLNNTFSPLVPEYDCSPLLWSLFRRESSLGGRSFVLILGRTLKLQGQKGRIRIFGVGGCSSALFSWGTGGCD